MVTPSCITIFTLNIQIGIIFRSNCVYLDQTAPKKKFYTYHHNNIFLFCSKFRITVDLRYLEVQGTLCNTSRYPYLDISDLQN